jgi:hypothetical protein
MVYTGIPGIPGNDIIIPGMVYQYTTIHKIVV